MRDVDGANIVTLKTGVGTANAEWASRIHGPEVGKEYDVELDLKVAIDRKTNARNADTSVPGLFIDGDHVVLRATIESLEDDGVAYLRLAQDCLVMVETLGEFSAGDVIQASVQFASLSVTLTGRV